MNIDQAIHQKAKNMGIQLWDQQRYQLADANKLSYSTIIKFDEKKVPHAEDCSMPLNLNLFKFADEIKFTEQSIYAGEMKIVQPFSMQVDLPTDCLSHVAEQIKNLPNDYFELWPRDHNVNNGFHFPDPWGDATLLLEALEKGLPIVTPSVNHNKISSKRTDKHSLDELHFDSFEGMRLDEAGHRMPIWRYFINLSQQSRTTAVALHTPALAEEKLPIDYEENMLDGIMNEMKGNLDMLILETPGADIAEGKLSGFKILTTHILHGEYGCKGDLLAIVNSLI